MDRLAILGGTPVIKDVPAPYVWVTDRTIERVGSLMREQKLSGFLAQPGENHLGGKWVQALERMFAKSTGSAETVGFNSWTSGLEAAFIALELEPLSEVIVPAWTMSATVASIVHAGLVPVFCDIEFDSFNLDPEIVSSLINSKTSGICAVDIFGRPSEIQKLRKIANENGLALVVDSAQCPGGTIFGSRPSKVGDIGGFSLNRHKHIQSGEGGMVITDDLNYAEKLRALRNHGEISTLGVTNRGLPIVGHNWRLGEIEALIALDQMDDFETHIGARRSAGEYISKNLASLPGLVISPLPQEIEHDYYILGMRFDEALLGLSRSLVASALQAEGVNFLITRYAGLHELPAFSMYKREKLIVTDLLNDSMFLGLYLCGHNFDENLCNQVIEAFHKVWSSLATLR